MKKAELLALIAALPDDAVVELVDSEYGGSNEIAGVRKAADDSGYMFNHHLCPAPSDTLYVLTTD